MSLMVAHLRALGHSYLTVSNYEGSARHFADLRSATSTRMS